MWVVLSGNLPSVRFARWSSDYLPIAQRFAAHALGGEVVECPYSGMVAAQKKLSAEYFFYLSYHPILDAEAIRVACLRCGYVMSERGKFQTIPHPPRLYVVAPKKSARITEADFMLVGDGSGYFAQAHSNGRLVLCRYGGGLFTHVPKWVSKKFAGAELLCATPTYAILEVPL